MNTLSLYLAVTVLGITALPAPLRSEEQPVHFDGIGQVIQRWQPDQHLYVEGNLGVAPEQLARLEEWLDQNGPHWSVVLMRNAAGESYQATDGRFFHDMDAVEYALGHGLPNRTAFGELENGVTGETDGAVFVMFLDERKFSYYGSDAQDRRGLGESEWMGNLDRPAFRAMRSNGRIIDAVRDTVKSINENLAVKVQREVAEKQRIERERERAMIDVRDAITAASSEIEKVESSATALRAEFPEASGPLTWPPLDEWRSRLNVLESELNPENVRNTAQELDELAGQIARYRNAYFDEESLEKLLAPLSEEISQVGTTAHQVAEQRSQLKLVTYEDDADIEASAEERLREAQQQLEEARKARTQGDLDILQHIQESRQAIDQAKIDINQEKESIRRATFRQRLIRNAVLGTAAILLTGLGIMLTLFNRRRKPAKEAAVKAFAEREKSVRKEMDDVLRLISHSNEILGSKEKVLERGYEGETKTLTDETFESVDDLLIMSNEVERVVKEARDLIHPKNPLDQAVNLFSSARFERGVHRISGEPLRFHRDKGVPIVLERDQVAKLAPGEEPPVEMTYTFERVFQAFRDRSDGATQMLDVIEGSLLQVNDQLQELRKRIDSATNSEQELDKAADVDGFFHVPAFFETFLPSVNKTFDHADDISGVDPVQANQKVIPLAMRQIDETTAVTKSIERARRDVFPILEGSKPPLQNLGYDLLWMEQQVLDLTDQANGLFAAVIERSIATEAEQFYEAVTDLGETASGCVKLAEELDQKMQPAQEQLRTKIQAARQQIGQVLSLDPTQTLAEVNHNPDNHLSDAMRQYEAARAALNRGGLPAAIDATQTATAQIAAGNQIVEQTLAGLRDFRDDLQQRRKEAAQTSERLPVYQQLVVALQTQFADSALRLKAGDAAYPDDATTVRQLVESASQQTAESHAGLDRADQLFRQGKILEANSLVDEARQVVNASNGMLERINRHHQLLQDKSQQNQAALAAADGYQQRLAAELSDGRITHATLAQFSRAQQRAGRIQESMAAATLHDPFQDASSVAELDKHLAHIEAMIQADFAAHAEATRAVQGAQAQLASGRRLVQQAATDQIPDSPLTGQCIREVEGLATELDKVTRQLNIPHEDWQEVDVEAARIHGALGVVSGRLQGELQRAQRSYDILQEASREVYQATRWTGGYGIRIGGAFGAGELERARHLLRTGDYDGMIQWSRSAIMAAQQAVMQAQREIERRQREEQRRVEEERRRQARAAQRRSYSSSGPTITFGGGSRGGGGGSRGGGSGSGFSRSGW